MQNPKILLPLDFSEAAPFTIKAAKKMAQLLGGTITPFHAYLPVADIYSPGAYGIETSSLQANDPEQMEEIYTQNLKETIEEKLPPELVADFLVRVGKPDQAITAAAEAFDLIIMGTHGRSGFSRFLMGSTSDKVLRTAHTPVLVVNKEQQIQHLERIMVTTDFSDNAKAAFPIALQIAEKCGAKIELIHVLNFNASNTNAPDESVEKQRRQRLQATAKEYFHALGNRVETRLIRSTHSPHEAIINDNLNNPHDLIVMATVGRTGLKYLMMGGTASRVVQHTKSPVLSVNPKNVAD